jgi:hypothetical protein
MLHIDDLDKKNLKNNFNFIKNGPIRNEIYSNININVYQQYNFDIQCLPDTIVITIKEYLHSNIIYSFKYNIYKWFNEETNDCVINISFVFKKTHDYLHDFNTYLSSVCLQYYSNKLDLGIFIRTTNNYINILEKIHKIYHKYNFKPNIKRYPCQIRDIGKINYTNRISTIQTDFCNLAFFLYDYIVDIILNKN